MRSAMSSAPTGTLATFAAGLAYEDLPTTARTHARNLLIDTVAAAFAADFSDESLLYAGYARAAAGEGNSTIIASEERLSVLGATLLNSYLITAATICDVYVPTHVHVSPEVLAPALAIAEQEGSSGKHLLLAIAVGCEVAVRVARGLKHSVAANVRGWHFPGIVGPFGAAAAVGKLRGLAPIQMQNAFGLAGSQSAGTYACQGTAAVKFHQSRGAVSGLIAALLAGEGFAASPEVLTDADGGLFGTYSDGGIPEAATADLGEAFEFERISLRLWPGGTGVQPILTSLFEVIAKERPRLRDVERLRLCITPGFVKSHNHHVVPKGTFDALISPRFLAASGLQEGRLWLDVVTPEKFADPELVSFLRERVDLVAAPELTKEQSRVEIVLKDGRVLSGMANAAKGSPENPATLGDIRTKYARCTEGRMDDREAERLFDLLSRLAELDDLSELFSLMRSARDRPLRH